MSGHISYTTNDNHMAFKVIRFVSQAVKNRVLLVSELELSIRQQERFVYVAIREGWRLPFPIPENAQWIAMDASGSVFWYDQEPNACGSYTWASEVGECGVITKILDPDRYDWTKTLTGVPKA